MPRASLWPSHYFQHGGGGTYKDRDVPMRNPDSRWPRIYTAPPWIECPMPGLIPRCWPLATRPMRYRVTWGAIADPFCYRYGTVSMLKTTWVAPPSVILVPLDELGVPTECVWYSNYIVTHTLEYYDLATGNLILGDWQGPDVLRTNVVLTISYDRNFTLWSGCGFETPYGQKRPSDSCGGTWSCSNQYASTSCQLWGLATPQVATIEALP